MISAAKALMTSRKSEDFTLQEVSVKGRVSIGSIYHIFNSKDQLVRAVIVSELEGLSAAERAVISRALKISKSLDEFVPNFISGFAKALRDNALMLRLAMQRAARDAQTSGAGNREAQASVERATAALLTFQPEIVGDAETKLSMVYQMIFAVLARHLSIDSQDPMAMNRDLNQLVQELSWMTLAYLKSPRPSH
jgi:AcrR family transcriptional regulator